MSGVAGVPRWSRADLAAAPVAVVEAARWAVFVERLWPSSLVEDLERPDTESMSEGQLKHARTQARLAGRKLVREIRALIFPKDAEEPAVGA